MSYALQADYTLRFNSTETLKITDRTNSGSIDTAVLQAGLDDAAGYMDSWIGGRYVLPIIAPFSQAMIACNCDLARWFLYVGDRPDQVDARKTEWDKWLTDVKGGIAGLGMVVPHKSVIGRAEFIQPLTKADAPGRTFTSDQMKLY